MPNLKLLSRFFVRLLSTLERAFLKLIEPSRHSLTHSIATDLPRSKSQLIAENSLLRQQLIILRRQVNKLHFTQPERLWLVLLASRPQLERCTSNPETRYTLALASPRVSTLLEIQIP